MAKRELLASVGKQRMRDYKSRHRGFDGAGQCQPLAAPLDTRNGVLCFGVHTEELWLIPFLVLVNYGFIHFAMARLARAALEPY